MCIDKFIVLIIILNNLNIFVDLIYLNVFFFNFSLYVQTNPWPEQAQYIRHRFEINRHLVTPEDVEAATSAGDQWLKDNYHPDLYVRKASFPLSLFLLITFKLYSLPDYDLYCFSSFN